MLRVCILGPDESKVARRMPMRTLSSQRHRKCLYEEVSVVTSKSQVSSLKSEASSIAMSYDLSTSHDNTTASEFATSNPQQ